MHSELNFFMRDTICHVCISWRKIRVQYQRRTGGQRGDITYLLINIDCVMDVINYMQMRKAQGWAIDLLIAALNEEDSKVVNWIYMRSKFCTLFVNLGKEIEYKLFAFISKVFRSLRSAYHVRKKKKSKGWRDFVLIELRKYIG